MGQTVYKEKIEPENQHLINGEVTKPNKNSLMQILFGMLTCKA